MRTGQPRVKIRRAALLLVALMASASCSEQPAPEPEKGTAEAARELVRESKVETAEGEEGLQPEEDQIAEDCVALVRATKALPAQPTSTDCPGCPVPGSDVLSFRHMKTDAVSCSGETCSVAVTIRAVLNAGSGETIAGGLTAWIPPEQRSAYLSGQTPAGEQAYRVQITYKRHGAGWRAIEFDRAPGGD